MRWQEFASISLFLASSNLAALAQAPLEQKSQEDWLRFSNWEHRANSSRHRAGARVDSDSNAATSAPLDSGSAKRARTNPNSEDQSLDDGSRLSLPENPGSQTVQGAAPSIPGWAFQPPAQVQRSPELFLGNDNFGSPAAYLSPYASPFRSYHGGNSELWAQSPYGPNNAYPIAGYSGWMGGSSGFSGRLNSFNTGNFLNSGYSRNHAFGPSASFPLMPFGSWQNRSPLGGASEVIETGPSPASGNYFQPPASDPSASGNYYAGGAPWQVPVSTPSASKDYWGPAGSPFNK